MATERQTFDQLLEVLDQTMSLMGQLHGKPGRAGDFGTGVTLHRAEIHTMDAIGSNRGINVTKLAERMDVTKGAASQMVTRLVKKGMVRRVHPEDDARETLLELTELGWVGFHEHEAFHAANFDTARQTFGSDFQERTERLIAALEDLCLVARAMAAKR